ncbi:MAG: RNA 3'-terminal phosphate cyclase [Nitrososphaerota archaeon]|nr:RNA 3'-terminal phosphate cyclase [Aigarchaeota archaeon]MDW8077171.1 RNA 3'-terminal phosphate cyclase [Nitrososphaerota archaeon]
MCAENVIGLDGSIGEGGGQVLRTAIALSAMMLRPIKIYNIRAKRSPPGLRPQHLTAVKAVAWLSNADVKGLNVGSSEVVFIPKRLKGGKMTFDAGTAGSTTLILQSLMPAMSFAEEQVEVEIRGGTNNPMAPPFEYLSYVLLPVLKQMGCKFSLELMRRGFYPRGQGIVRVRSEPVDYIKPIRLTEFSGVEKISGISYSCRLPSHIAERMAKSASKFLSMNGYDNADIWLEVLQPDTPKCSVDAGCGIILFARTKDGHIIASDSLGRLGVPAEKIGEEVAADLVKQLNAKAPVDKHLGDQLVIWVAIAKGYSEYRVTELTLHTLTSVEVCKRLTGAEFMVDGAIGESGMISCNGIGLTRKVGK